MSFFDSISRALGTDGSHSGLNLQGFTDSVSNALGTDGSKNGLLNDPYSQAALALAGGAYFGYIPVGGSASVGGAVATTEAATGAAASYAAGGAVADAAATAAGVVNSAYAGSALPSWLTLSNVGTAATIGSKLLGGSSGGGQRVATPGSYSPGYYTVNNITPNRQQPQRVAAAGTQAAPDYSLFILGALALILLK